MMTTRSRPDESRWPTCPAWSPFTRLWVLTIMIVAIAIMWWQVRQFTIIVILALLLAYILNPAIEFVRRRLRRSRPVATLTVYTAMALVTILGPASVAPGLAQSVNAVNLKQTWTTIYIELLPILPSQLNLLGQAVELRPIYAQFDNDIQSAAAGMVQSDALIRLLGLATDVVFTVFGLFVTFMVSLYIALDKDRIFEWLESKVPRPYHEVYRVLRADIDAVWQSFFRGQLILAVVIGVATTLGLVVLGVPYAIPLGIIAGILEVVPRLGPVLSVVPAIAVALVQHSHHFPDLARPWYVLLVAGLYVLIQQLENNFLVPRILGSSVNLPPAVILVGALAGASVAGIPGILLAAPVLGSIRVLGSWLFYQVTRVEALPPAAPEQLAGGP